MVLSLYLGFCLFLLMGYNWGGGLAGNLSIAALAAGCATRVDSLPFYSSLGRSMCRFWKRLYV